MDRTKNQIDLRIRCDSGLRRLFREFVAKNDFKNYAEALEWLLRNAPPLESKAPIKTYIGSERA